VLSGRSFLGTKHTLRHIRSELVVPVLSYLGGLNEWVASGHSGVVDLASEKAAELVERLPWACPATSSTLCADSLSTAPPRSGFTSTPTRGACSGCRLKGDGR